MNLITIQKRVEELSAELLTLSNAIARVVGASPAGVVTPVTDFAQLRAGLEVTISEAFTVPWSDEELEAGTYVVVEVESEDYDGLLSVLIDIGNRTVWIDMKKLIRDGLVTFATI